MTFHDRWTLTGFAEAHQRWVASEAPGPLLQKQVLRWIVELGDNPHPPDSGPAGDGFDATWRFAKLPVGSTPDSRVVCLYRIDPFARELACASLNELNEPI